MPKASHSTESAHVRGKVVALNISPRGHVEGILVATARGTVQVNLPMHPDAALAASYRPGSEVDVRAEVEAEDGEHAVFRLVEADVEVTGEVVRLNYALHGEVNGFHLDDGTFVHLKPEGAAKQKVRVGETVTITGVRKVGPDATVIGAQEVKRGRTRDKERGGGGTRASA